MTTLLLQVLPMSHLELRQPASMTRNSMDSITSLTPTLPDKKGETIDEMIRQLPPHGTQSCITNTQDNETIDKLISRIPMSEGLYKLYWILTQKAKSPELDAKQRKVSLKKARSAVNRTLHLFGH